MGKALVYVTEPGQVKSVGATGTMVLIRALREGGNEVKRVVFKSKAVYQPELFSTIVDTVPDATYLPAPTAWFVSVLFVRQFIRLPLLFRRMGLPPLAADRGPDDPLIVFGGQSMIAPEPIAEFADIMALGDGEHTGKFIVDLLAGGATKTEIMAECDNRHGFYVPSRHTPGDGFIFRRAETDNIRPYCIQPHERGKGSSYIEVARGCKNKCLFCAIGWAGGTYREHPKDQVLAELDKSVHLVNMFAPEVSSVSYIAEVNKRALRDKKDQQSRDVRLDKIDEVMKYHQSTKRYGFGLDGLSEKIRLAVGKKFKHVDVVMALERLGLEFKVTGIRMYQIGGFPGETDEDWDEFARLLVDVKNHFNGRVLVTITHFMPVPHTPLQWSSAYYNQNVWDFRQEWDKKIRVWWEEEKKVWTFLNPKSRETHEHDMFLQRGDRRFTKYILKLQGKESWIVNGKWRDVAAAVGLEPAETLQTITPGAVTPWSHVDVGVKSETCRRAYRRYNRLMDIDERGEK